MFVESQGQSDRAWQLEGRERPFIWRKGGVEIENWRLGVIQDLEGQLETLPLVATPFGTSIRCNSRQIRDGAFGKSQLEGAAGGERAERQNKGHPGTINFNSAALGVDPRVLRPFLQAPQADPPASFLDTLSEVEFEKARISQDGTFCRCRLLHDHFWGHPISIATQTPEGDLRPLQRAAFNVNEEALLDNHGEELTLLQVRLPCPMLGD
mmetsp:Transcript_103908/g.260604  ORF Transcript_103908/g.260604 Transcript_103908/m.260604 type:complete len:210 (-) Transcript_103908:82-711(-)